MSTRRGLTALSATFCALLTAFVALTGISVGQAPTPATFVTGSVIATCSVANYQVYAPYVVAVGDFNNDGVPGSGHSCWATAMAASEPSRVHYHVCVHFRGRHRHWRLQ
jgi:predicted membrane-bound spermidine synthase